MLVAGAEGNDVATSPTTVCFILDSVLLSRIPAYPRPKRALKVER